METINIKLIKSFAGRNKNQMAVAHSLGLKKIGDCVKQPNNEQTKGKIRKISHLIEIATDNV